MLTYIEQKKKGFHKMTAIGLLIISFHFNIMTPTGVGNHHDPELFSIPLFCMVLAKVLLYNTIAIYCSKVYGYTTMLVKKYIYTHRQVRYRNIIPIPSYI